MKPIVSLAPKCRSIYSLANEERAKRIDVKQSCLPKYRPFNFLKLYTFIKPIYFKLNFKICLLKMRSCFISFWNILFYCQKLLWIYHRWILKTNSQMLYWWFANWHGNLAFFVAWSSTSVMTVSSACIRWCIVFWLLVNNRPWFLVHNRSWFLVNDRPWFLVHNRPWLLVHNRPWLLIHNSWSCLLIDWIAATSSITWRPRATAVRFSSTVWLSSTVTTICGGTYRKKSKNGDSFEKHFQRYRLRVRL